MTFKQAEEKKWMCDVSEQIREQNPGKRILLADLLRYVANSLLFLCLFECHATLTVERVESDY